MGATDKARLAETRTDETKRFIRDIRRVTRRRFTAEEKIRIVLEVYVVNESGTLRPLGLEYT